jgi:hypothetical protein
MEKALCMMIVAACLLAGNNIQAQVIALSNFGVHENSYYQADKISKSMLSGNSLNLAGLSKTSNFIPPSLTTFTIKPQEEARDALFECEGNLTSLWKQYEKISRDKKIKTNYQELYRIWQTKDKFCSDLLDKIALKLFFNFIAPAHATYYLQKIIVIKLAYPGARGGDLARDWMSGFQRENGFQALVLTPSLENDTILLEKPLIIEKQGTLHVSLSSKHYQNLMPGSLQQGNYILQLKFVFMDSASKKHAADTPVFLVRI